MISQIQFLLLFLFLCSSLVPAKAQEQTLKLTTKVSPTRAVDFEYLKTDPGSYTVLVKLNNLANTSSASEQVFACKDYSGRLFALTPDNKEQGVGYSYSYTYIRGALNPKFNAGFQYLLPCKKGTKLKVYEVDFLGEKYFGNTTPADWKVYRFATPVEDSVASIRKGKVVEVKDLNERNQSGVVYTSKQNSIIIEHPDGTLALYSGLKKGSFTVKVGQTVFPGTTIGVNSRSGDQSHYSVTLMLKYLKSKDIESHKNETLKTAKSLYGFITPRFFTAENTNLILEANQEYTAADTPEILHQELSRKELKLLAK